MRPSQTRPGTDNARADSWNPEVESMRGDTADSRTDNRSEMREMRTDDDQPLRRQRAGTPVEGIGAGSWQDIKSRFVDDPAGAIAAAEELVQLAVENKIRALRDEAAAVCAADRDDASSSSATENLRMRLIRYQDYCRQLAERPLH